MTMKTKKELFGIELRNYLKSSKEEKGTILDTLGNGSATFSVKPRGKWCQGKMVSGTFSVKPRWGKWCQVPFLLNPADHTVTLDNGEVLKYEKLLLAVGGSPRPIPIPGADKLGVHYLRNLAQTKDIIREVAHVKKGVSIGGGIIGFEMAEMMVLGGLDTTFIYLNGSEGRSFGKYFFSPKKRSP